MNRQKSDRQDKLKRDLENAGVIKRTVFIALANRRKMIITLVIFVAVLSALSYAVNKNEMSAVVSLNYEQAAKGMNPNNTRFNIYEIKSDSVMERAITLAGLDGAVETEDLSDNIDVRETSSKKFDADDDTTYYISTSYIINYKKSRKIKGISTYDMLSLICKAYNDYFHDNYVGSNSVLNYSLEDVDSVEYVAIGNYFTRIADQIIRYLDVRGDESPTFRSSETGETFQSLRKMVNNTKSYSIQKYISYVNETGLAKNRSHFLQTLLYRESMYSMAYEKSIIGYNVRKQGVTDYDSSMIGTVMIPSIDKNNEYYMSRTNTGTDYLAKAADDYLEDADYYMGELLANENITYNIQNKESTAEDAAKADEMISSIDHELTSLALIANKTDKDYLQYTTKDYITFALTEQGILGRIHLNYVIVFAFLFAVLLAFWFNFTYTAQRKREETDASREEGKA